MWLIWNVESLLTSPVHNGAYLANSGLADPRVDTVKPWGTSLSEAEQLWELGEKLVEQKFSY